MHSKLDLNLLVALDALLEENSVTAAAGRLHLSEPAMSRTLARIRRSLGDPVLVRSGRVMVPTPRALAIRMDVHDLVERARTLFSAGPDVDLSSLTRVFTVQADDALVAVAGAPLLAGTAAQAPGVTVRFVGEGPYDAHLLRQGMADLEIGVIIDPAPETRVELLMTDRFVGLVRRGHPLTRGKLTPERFAAADHLSVSRRGRLTGPIDTLLAERGLARRVAASCPTFCAAVFLLQTTDLVGISAERLHRHMAEQAGLVTFEIPLDLEPLRIAQAWHARYDADSAHAWLRHLVHEAVASTE
jgi:DNA-binding transcriptional LysR family regulator